MRTRAALLSLALALVLAPPAMATFPGRNGLLAVAADTDSSSDTIWVGRVDGWGMRALPSPCPPGPPDPAWDTCSVGAPVWSPDGTRLAFTSVRGSNPQTWIVNADGSDLHQVRNAAGFFPAWSPDGTRLAFSVDAWDNQECHFRDLYTVNVDGSGLSLLTPRGDNPDWSVRGQIVFERLREYWTSGDAAECEPQASLAVIRPGGQPRRVGWGLAPSWAPNGRAIAYSFRGGIWRKQIAAEGPGRLLSKAGAYEVAWSPNGRLIAYRTSRRLKLMGARRGLPRPIAFDAPGIDFSVDWQPLPR
jgi:dipeptidyl aminopeptidase/acylaminoacyl peptidase